MWVSDYLSKQFTNHQWKFAHLRFNLQICSHNSVKKKKKGLVPVYINAITSSKSNSQISDIDMQIFLNLRGFAHPCGRHLNVLPCLEGS